MSVAAICNGAVCVGGTWCTALGVDPESNKVLGWREEGIDIEAQEIRKRRAS